MSQVGYLECPECGEEALPSKSFGCRDCDDGCHEERARSGECARTLEPLWLDGDEGFCPSCGQLLRVAVDDSHAWARVAAEAE